MKFIITFGSDHLQDFDISAIKTALIVDGDDENQARSKVFKYHGIGEKFCTSYPYSMKKDIIDKYNMIELSLGELESYRIQA